MVGEFIQLDTDIWEQLPFKQVNSAGNLFIGKGYAENYEFRVFARRVKKESAVDVMEGINSISRISELTGRTGSGKTTTAIKIGMKYIEDGKTVLYLARRGDIENIPGIFRKELMVNNLKPDQLMEFSDYLRITNVDLIIMDEITGSYPERMERYKMLDSCLSEDTKVIAIRQNNKTTPALTPVIQAHSAYVKME